ncbi:hypothetical protein [uncultured Trichococcus sp.]|uniref:hypothetical protein n=1 Tax=uncultured Trichococcus sp. TaxID=189665 RepID=UPI002A18A53E|nr:hypothetical protein [uncultured Trichococcus sp.]
MSRIYKFEYIALLLEQISENQDRIGKLVADAESGESIDLLKRESEKLTARNESLLNLVADMIEEVKKYPGTVPPIRPTFF